MSGLPVDPLLEILVELRDLKLRVGVLISRVNDAIIAQGERPVEGESLHHCCAPIPAHICNEEP